MTESKDYLQPESYDNAPIWARLLFALSHYGREIVLVLLPIAVVLLVHFTGGTWEDALSYALIFGFLTITASAPIEVSKQAKEYDSRGESLPSSFGDLREKFSSAFVPSSVAAGIGLTLVVYGWSNPPQVLFRGTVLTQILAFLTNICIASSVSAWSWKFALSRISQGKFDGLWAGAEVLAPLALVSIATSVISITSGVAHWQDSISFYLPGLAISFYAELKSASKGYLSPAVLKDQIEELEGEEGELRKKLEWLALRKGKEGNTDLTHRFDETKGRLTALGGEISRRRKALSVYGVLVSKVILSIESYESRRNERELILRQESARPSIRPELKDRLGEAMAKMARPPSKEPRPFTGTRLFRLMKARATVLTFPLVLQSMQFYLPTVSLPDAAKLADQLDRSTFEEYDPSAFEYFLRSNEVPEVIWLWTRVPNEASARHCVQFLRDCKIATERHIQLTAGRIEQFKRITAKDPESQYGQIMITVEGRGPSLSTGLRIGTSKLKLVSDAYKLVEPFAIDLGITP